MVKKMTLIAVVMFVLTLSMVSTSFASSLQEGQIKFVRTLIYGSGHWHQEFNGVLFYAGNNSWRIEIYSPDFVGSVPVGFMGNLMFFYDKWGNLYIGWLQSCPTRTIPGEVSHPSAPTIGTWRTYPL